MSFLVAVIARDLGSIYLIETVPTSSLWGFFLGFSGLGSISFRGVGLGDIFLTRGGASLSVSSPSLAYLFLFSLSFFGGF